MSAHESNSSETAPVSEISDPKLAVADPANSPQATQQAQPPEKIATLTESEKNPNQSEVASPTSEKKFPELGQITNLDSFFERLEEAAEKIITKLHESPGKKTWGRKIVNFAKDLGPVLTALATIIITCVVSYYTYKFNERQAAATQASSRTATLNDFTEVDQGKRALAAIKLAGYGNEALPDIKQALGAEHELIRNGGMLTAKTMYRSQPENRPELLRSLLGYLEDSNLILRRGVLQFYIEMAAEVTVDEKRDFFRKLEAHLGLHAARCSEVDGEFVMEAATFISQCPFPETKDLLLDIAKNCPHTKADDDRPGKYEGARYQAISMLPLVVEQQRLPKNERASIIKELRNLEADASEEFRRHIETAITLIQESETP